MSAISSDGAGDGQTLDAGEFGEWLQQMRAALTGQAGMDVPCGECVGCCTSHYSILLRPHDAALDIVPARFQSGLRSLPYPHMKMKPLANGHCPMFVAQGCGGHCSIYAQRPQTCLDYDCRIFAATGIDPGDRPVINQRVKAWRFRYHDESARHWHQAVQSAAQFLTDHAAGFPPGWLPDYPSGHAVLAIKTCELFMRPGFEALPVSEQIQQLMHQASAFDRSGRTGGSDALQGCCKSP